MPFNLFHIHVCRFFNIYCLCIWLCLYSIEITLTIYYSGPNWLNHSLFGLTLKMFRLLLILIPYIAVLSLIVTAELWSGQCNFPIFFRDLVNSNCVNDHTTAAAWIVKLMAWISKHLCVNMSTLVLIYNYFIWVFRFKAGSTTNTFTFNCGSISDPRSVNQQPGSNNHSYFVS